MVLENWKKETPVFDNKEIGKEFIANPIDGILCSQQKGYKESLTTEESTYYGKWKRLKKYNLYPEYSPSLENNIEEGNNLVSEQKSSLSGRTLGDFYSLDFSTFSEFCNMSIWKVHYFHETFDVRWGFLYGSVCS